MNYSIIRYILGWVITFESVFMLFPCLAAGIYKEESGFIFLICAVVSGAIG